MRRYIYTLFSLIIACVKLFLARIIASVFCRHIINRNIWLISEKTTEARDNGYHLYKFLEKNHPEIRFYYVIKKGAVDESKIDSHRVLHYLTMKHCVYALCAKYMIGGQGHYNRPYYKLAGSYSIYNLFKRRDQKIIFIRHGIGKDNIPSSFDPQINPYDLIITGVKREYEFDKYTYQIPDSKIALTGLCRFDNLHDIVTKKQILIMPTFRRSLAPKDSRKPIASPEELSRFVKSEYFNKYISLINNDILIEEVKEHGLYLIFYLHYTFQPYINLFKEKFKNLGLSNVIIADRYSFDVQQLLKESKFLITDYSSVFFDFAYMKKPLVYYQFDESDYRKEHYKKGWFSYQQDGFGPVIEDEKTLVDYISRIIKTNFNTEDAYKKRIEEFFIPYDKNNCERVYNEIIKIS